MELAREAAHINPWAGNIQGTLGITLIENGDFEAGLQALDRADASPWINVLSIASFGLCNCWRALAISGLQQMSGPQTNRVVHPRLGLQKISTIDPLDLLDLLESTRLGTRPFDPDLVDIMKTRIATQADPASDASPPSPKPAS